MNKVGDIFYTHIGKEIWKNYIIGVIKDKDKNIIVYKYYSKTKGWKYEVKKEWLFDMFYGEMYHKTLKDVRKYIYNNVTK